jgi:hypothetical protein
MISAANSRWRGCQRILRKGSPITSTLPPQERRKSGERELPQVSAGSANWPVLPIGRLLDALLRIGSRSLTVVTAADGASTSPANAQLMANRR